MKLIDGDELINHLRTLHYDINTINIIQQIINSMHECVKTAQLNKTSNYRVLECSHCGQYVAVDDLSYWNINYCPHCGYKIVKNN